MEGLEEGERQLVAGKPRDVNGNGILRGIGVKAESVEEAEPVGARARWQGRVGLGPCGVVEQFPRDGRDSTQGPGASFLPGLGHAPPQMYIYNSDQRQALPSTATLRFSSPDRKTGADGEEGHGLPPTPGPGNPYATPEGLSGENGPEAGSGSPPASVECVVCNDKSSGKHYGQYTCEGCKSFFKRSVRRNLSYTCRGNRACPVDLQHRNQCQYCRFQKCIKVGMRREAVQKGRVPPNNVLVYQPSLGCSIATWQNQEGSAGMHGVAVLPTYSLRPFIVSLVKTEDLFAVRFSSVSRTDALGDQSGHLLLSIIEWAKKMPHFSDLPLPDQVLLLKNCWHDLFLVIAIQVAMPLPVAQMVSVCVPPDTDRMAVLTQVGEVSRALQSQLERVARLGLDVAEYASMKALILFSPDVLGLSAQSQVEGIQEKIQCGLEEHARVTYPNQPSRFGRLLLRLLSLCKASAQMIEQLILMRLVSRESVESLVRNFLLQPAHLPSGVQHHSAGLASFGAPGHSNMGPTTSVGSAGVSAMASQLPSPCISVSAAGPIQHQTGPGTPSGHQHTGSPLWLAASSSSNVEGLPIGLGQVAMGMTSNNSGGSSLIAGHQSAI